VSAGTGGNTGYADIGRTIRLRQTTYPTRALGVGDLIVVRDDEK
jgi:hypothetical protein